MQLSEFWAQATIIPESGADIPNCTGGTWHAAAQGPGVTRWIIHGLAANGAVPRDRRTGESARRAAEAAAAAQRQSGAQSLIASSRHASQLSVLGLVHEPPNKLVPLKPREPLFPMPN